ALMLFPLALSQDGRENPRFVIEHEESKLFLSRAPVVGPHQASTELMPSSAFGEVMLAAHDCDRDELDPVEPAEADVELALQSQRDYRNLLADDVGVVRLEVEWVTPLPFSDLDLLVAMDLDPDLVDRQLCVVALDVDGVHLAVYVGLFSELLLDGRWREGLILLQHLADLVAALFRGQDLKVVCPHVDALDYLSRVPPDGPFCVDVLQLAPEQDYG